MNNNIERIITNVQISLGSIPDQMLYDELRRRLTSDDENIRWSANIVLNALNKVVSNGN